MRSTAPKPQPIEPELRRAMAILRPPPPGMAMAPEPAPDHVVELLMAILAELRAIRRDCEL